MEFVDQFLAEVAAVPLSTLVLGAIATSLLAMIFALVAALRGGGKRTEALELALASLATGQERFERSVSEAMTRSRQESGETARHLREEVNASIDRLSQSLSGQQREQGAALGESSRQLGESVRLSLDTFREHSNQQSAQLFTIQKDQHANFEQRVTALTEAHRTASEALRSAIDTQLTGLRQDNSAKLEAMRMTVDEKLQGTLEQRLGESFKLVSERLDAVHKGLGEMQNLATGVGDLKRVLTNVKARGSWGEVQLGSLLEQVLTPSQYAANVAIAENSSERVEFAIILPGDDRPVYLPIDAKFPIEDYERLQAAADIGDVDAVETAAKALEMRLRNSAKDISTKYVHPPRSTDFAIMFLPTEGLYAEALRRPGLVDDLQRTYRIVVAGPTTLTAILNSLQMGFRTLAIQERSSEVWQVLGGVKAEFGKFGDVLTSVKKKLQEASNHIDRAEVRTRAINRKLRDVEEIAPSGTSTPVLGSFEDLLGDDAEDGDDNVVKPSAYLHGVQGGRT